MSLALVLGPWSLVLGPCLSLRTDSQDLGFELQVFGLGLDLLIKSSKTCEDRKLAFERVRIYILFYIIAMSATTRPEYSVFVVGAVNDIYTIPNGASFLNSQDGN